MKKKFKSFIIWFLSMLILGYAAGIVISYFNNNRLWEMSILYSQLALICAGVGALVGLCLGVYYSPKNKDKSSTKGKTASGQEFDLHFDSGFMSREKVISDKFLINSTWTNLPALKNTGMLVRNELIGSRYEVTMKDEMHGLIIGTTGTGKTSMIIDPAIRIYAHTAEKPTLIITDPKGELYNHHARALIEEGYNVVVYNLDNPYTSTRWNPMERPYDMYHRAMNIYKEAKKYSGVSPKQAGKTPCKPDAEFGESWFEFEGIAFPDEESLNKRLEGKKQQLINESLFDLRGIASCLCPVTPSSNDTMWEQGAQDYLLGIMLAMLEDSIDPRLGENKLKKEQFNFYNLYKIATKRDSNSDGAFETLKRYCSNRSKTSDVPTLTSPVIDSAETTSKSYMSVLSGKISNLLQDIGIGYATSASEMKFDEFVDKPTALFLKVPDHKKERYSIATICITQLYRTLVDLANKYSNLKLPRHVYFLIDEFGNFPAIPDFGTMVTVSRSRNVLFAIVIQSFAQLETKYGKDVSETIKGNFNVQIFLGTEDIPTREAFSKSCGEVQLITNEEQVTKNEGKDSNSKSTSIQKQKSVRPLIDPYELSVLPFGVAIAKVFRFNPIKCNLAQFHNTPQMIKYPPLPDNATANALDEAKVFYDITKRNQIIFGRHSFF